MKTLIIGGGEIGSSLFKILSIQYDVNLIDIDENKNKSNIINIYNLYEPFEIMHICFPYSDKFIEQVEEYKNKYNPKYIVVHSTVPIGTCTKLGAIHSPVEGLHPFLDKSILTFIKFLAGPQASEVADYFRRANIKIYLVDKPESTELMKIMSTTLYGVQIEFAKEMKKLCEKYGVPYELYTLWNDNYNKSYESLGHPEYKKPLLVPIMKPQGGHCVRQNALILDNDFTELIRKRNGDLK